MDSIHHLCNDLDGFLSPAPYGGGSIFSMPDVVVSYIYFIYFIFQLNDDNIVSHWIYLNFAVSHPGVNT